VRWRCGLMSNYLDHLYTFYEQTDDNNDDDYDDDDIIAYTKQRFS